MNNNKNIEFDWRDDLNNSGHVKGKLVELEGSGYLDVNIKIKTEDNKFGILKPIPKMYKHTKVIIPDSINFKLQKVYQWELLK